MKIYAKNDIIDFYKFSLDKYKKLIVWNKSLELSKIIYEITNKFPKYEIHSLTNQIRRASISIVSNIAEGSVKGDNSFKYSLKISLGSAAELDTQFRIALGLSYLKNDEFTLLEGKLLEVIKMLITLIKKVENNSN